jgi:glutathione S-transferase
MKLYTAKRAPNPRRVHLFMAEKGLQGVEFVLVDLNQSEHKTSAFASKNPMARVPVLELDDGRFLSESRAICSYLEGLHPEPNLMGHDAEERAFIEMVDRHMEWNMFLGFAQAIRHTHPGLSALEQPQFVEFGRTQAEKAKTAAQILDKQLQCQPWVAGQRFTVADITAFCALDFARGLLKFSPGAEGLNALQEWFTKMQQRPACAIQ